MRVPRIRFSVRCLLLTVAIVGLGLGLYIHAGQRRAALFIDAQIDLLQRAARHEHQCAEAEQQRLARCREQAEQEAREAEKFPESSEERARHESLAAAWRNAAKPGNGIHGASARAELFEQSARDLQERRAHNWGRPWVLADMADESRAWLGSLGMRNVELPYEFAAEKEALYLEREALATGRSFYPTAFGPRRSVIEATAIWQAEQTSASTWPLLDLNGARAEAKQIGDRPLSWRVTFTDPSTRQTRAVETHFSRPTVLDYIAKHLR